MSDIKHKKKIVCKICFKVTNTKLNQLDCFRSLEISLLYILETHFRKIIILKFISKSQRRRKNNRETERQKDRQTERQRGREAERQKYRETERHKEEKNNQQRYTSI
jgi:hypothetical protein